MSPTRNRVRELIAGLDAKDARTKYGSAKALRQLAERQPEALYPHFDFFVGLLAHENRIFQWQGIIVFSHLVRVDVERKFDDLFAPYFALIRGSVMITAANVIGGAARIALARPEWADRITAEVLKVGRAHYQTDECRNVAIGHAIQTFDQIVHLMQDAKPVIRFVQRQLKNDRPATRKKAARFLRRHFSGPQR